MQTDLFGNPIEQDTPKTPPKADKRGFVPVDVPNIRSVPYVALKEGLTTWIFNLPRPGCSSIYD